MTLDEYHTRHLLGLPDRADDKGSEYEGRYGAVPHYSFLTDRRESHAGVHPPSRLGESITFTIEEPEHVPAFHFYVTEFLAVKEVIRRGRGRDERRARAEAQAQAAGAHQRLRDVGLRAGMGHDGAARVGRELREETRSSSRGL
jgi:hypothetical protein